MYRKISTLTYLNISYKQPSPPVFGVSKVTLIPGLVQVIGLEIFTSEETGFGYMVIFCVNRINNGQIIIQIIC